MLDLFALDEELADVGVALGVEVRGPRRGAVGEEGLTQGQAGGGTGDCGSGRGCGIEVVVGIIIMTTCMNCLYGGAFYQNLTT